MQSGGVGDVGRRKPEGHVGPGGLLLVGALGLHHLLPLHELRELLVVVLAEVAADGFDKRRQLALAGAAVGHEIGQHAARFLPGEVGIHELGAAYVCSEDGEKHGRDALLHVS